MIQIAVPLILLGIIILIGLGGGCTQPNKARDTLEAQGYTDIEITRWRPFMAGEGDTFSTGFIATSPGGKEVTGAVTSGLFKGKTIRLD